MVAAALVAALLVPFGHAPAPIPFQGDMILFAYLFGLARFFTMIAALDTGSSFEGMGAAREVTFSCLAEPALFLGLLALARAHRQPLACPACWPRPAWRSRGPPAPLIAGAGGLVFMVLLAENCRIPVDDPNTHLELTMIHEVMVLDHSGPAVRR